MARTIDAIIEAGHGGTITIDDFGPSGPQSLAIPYALTPDTPLETGIETGLAALPLVHTYYVTRSATGKVTIYTTGGPFILTLSGAAQSLLGYASDTYSAAMSYTGERVAAYTAQALGIELSPPMAAQDIRSESIRHGRVEGSIFGVGRRWRATAYIRSTMLPASLGWLQSRVRVVPAADTAALTETNLDGAIRAAVLSATWETVEEGLVRWSAELVEVPT